MNVIAADFGAKTMRNKRGRPRLNRPAIDLGTPEIQARRTAAIHGAVKGFMEEFGPHAPRAAEHPLGIMLARGHLHPDYSQARKMYDAGINFASAWVLAYPKVFPVDTLGSLQPGSSSEIQGNPIDDLKAICTFLGKERQVLDAVINTCVYRRVDPRKMEKLRTGLCRLIEFRRNRKAA